MNTCESTNELIRRATYDLMLIICIWGTANLTTTIALTDKNMKPDKAEKMALMMQFASIFTTVVGAYKYHQ